MDDAFPSEVDCDLKVSNFDTGDEQRNLVVRAYQALKADYPALPRCHAHLYKAIPTQAGMGGGSSDCAYMIRLLNDLFALHLSEQQMMAYAARLGADCAFFIKSRPCDAEGIGEQLEDVDLDLSGWHIAVVRPDIPVPTKEAFSRIRPHFPALPRCHAHLWKAIPTQAGMGGGSSDCAYMIRLLNDQFALHLSEQQMMQYAARLGADCAFFIKSRPCYAEGIGERLEDIDLDLSGWHIAVVRPDIPVPTKEAFSRIRPHYPAKNCRDVVRQPVDTWAAELVNDFEQSVFALPPELAAVKDRLYKMGATYAAMSGSGSALFGLFRERPDRLSQEFPRMFTFSSLL